MWRASGVTTGTDHGYPAPTGTDHDAELDAIVADLEESNGAE
jgi:hypothetical protein